MMGNLIYYVCLASAIQRTGAPVSTMIIGTLPVCCRSSPTCSTASATESCRGDACFRRWSVSPSAWCASISPNCARAAQFQPVALRLRYRAGAGIGGLLGLVRAAQRPLAAGKPG
jgi:hypothetical protein